MQMLDSQNLILISSIRAIAKNIRKYMKNLILLLLALTLIGIGIYLGIGIRTNPNILEKPQKVNIIENQ